MTSFQRKTAIPRLMITIGVALLAMAMGFEIHLIPEPHQASLGGLLAFLGLVWFLYAAGFFRRRP